MFFPDWAPAELTKIFTELKDKADEYRLRDQMAKSGEFDEFFTGHGIDWTDASDETEKRACILSRLLTNQDMKTTWSGLLSRPVNDPKPWKKNPASSLWNCIDRALKEFQDVIATSQTSAQKTKSLQSVIDKSQALIDAIADAPTASAMSRQMMATHLAIGNLKHRTDKGEMPRQAEYAMPMTLSSDCREALIEEMKGDDVESELEFTESYLWRELPLVSRLKYWVEEAEKTNLVDLLQLFIDSLKIEAAQTPEIKQPGRGDAAIKPFIIRRLSEYMTWYYGQPLDDAVACIVSIVMDLKNPLTRDDVRPYVAGTGKKLG